MNISTEYASLSPREAGMRLRRSIICCSSVLLCVVSASSASAWSIAGLLWTVADVCSSVGCFHTPSIIPFSTTDPSFCTKTTLSRYEGLFGFLLFLTASSQGFFLHFVWVFLSTHRADVGILAVTVVWSIWPVPPVRLIADAETCRGKWQEGICFTIRAPHIWADPSVVVLGRKPDPCHVHALHPVQWDLLRNAASLGSGWVSGWMNFWWRLQRYALFNTQNPNHCGDYSVALWPFSHFVFITFIYFY